jgi:simple sugar transport system ATP-binding protein
MLPDQPRWAVEMKGIDKHFGAVHANHNVSLRLKTGSITGVVGENGAGKSTLMSILYGLYSADAGSIEVDGKSVAIQRPQDAIALGIGMVHQHFMLVDTLSALDNIMLGAEPDFLLHKAARLTRSRLHGLMESTGLQVELEQLVSELSVGARQRLEILKLLFRGARVLILDEPTAVLTPQETRQLFEVLRKLAAQGASIVIITHKLKEVMALCQQVSVMRNGQVVLETSTTDTSIEALAHAMVGRIVHLGRDAASRPQTGGAVLLQAQGIHMVDALGVWRLQELDLSLRAGQIVGLAGVSGNGQSELLEVLSGMRAPQQGSLQLAARQFSPGHWLDPVLARQLGLAHVPEDRQGRALVMSFEAWESAVLGYQQQAVYSRRGRMLHASMRSSTERLMQRFDVRPRDVHLRCDRFSGGNQQKLVLAREVGQQPQVLLVGQPTRGVDIGAIEFIHAQLRALRAAGCAVLLVSSELDEILALSDRIIVMHRGRIAGELAPDQADEATLGLLMAGGQPS